MDKPEPARSKRLPIREGAGALEAARGVQLINSGMLPEQWRRIGATRYDGFAVLKNPGRERTSFAPLDTPCLNQRFTTSY